MKSPRFSQRGRTLCALHRRAPRALAFATLLGLAASPAALRAADFTYGGGTGNFSTGFVPAVSGATTADDLIFNGAAYTATDDVTNVNVNGVRFNNTGTVLVTPGTASNAITLGGANPYINFNNTGLVTVATNTTFTTSGFIVKSTAGAAETNPIISGGIALNTGTTVQVVLADTGGDGAAETAFTGAITGAGTLALQNNADLPAAINGNQGIAPVGNPQDYGTLLITGNNTGFTGATNVNSGRLVITNGNALGSGLVTVAGLNLSDGGNVSAGGTLAFGNGNYTNPAANGVITGGITIPNAVNLAGATSGNYDHGLENNTGNNTINGLVTLTGNSVVVVGNGGTALTMAGGVTETPGLGALLTKRGGFTLTVNNASYTGGTSIQGGTMQFNGTAPTAGQITVGTTAGQSTTALNFGTGTAFPTVASLLPLLNTGSTGSINLVASSSEPINFDTLSGGGTLSVGSAVPGPGVTYTGAITGSSVNLGGGTAGGVLTLPNANQITGGSSLTVGPIGANSTVFLSATNNYTAGTAIAGGTLEIASAASLGSGPLTFGAAVNVTGGGGTLQYAPGTTNNLAANDITAGGRTVTDAGFVAIDTNGNNVTYAGNFTAGTSQAPGSFTKLGLGTLTLNGAFGTSATATGATNLFVRQGAVTISGPTASFTTSSYSSAGANTGDNGTINITNGAKVIVAADFNVTDLNGSNGVVNISGANSSLAINRLYVGKGGGNGDAINSVTQGSVNQTGGSVFSNADGGDWRIGGNNSTTDGSQNAVGSYDLSGGTFNTTSFLQVGAFGTGQMTVSGTATATGAGYPSVGRFVGSYGVLNVLGGSFTQSGTGTFMLVGEDGTGILNVSGTGVVNAQNGPQLRVGNTAGTGVGVVNLGAGGTLNARALNTTAGATGILNFHGGTLAAATSAAGTAPATDFLSSLTSAYIYGEGGTIDTGANSVTIAQPLLAPGTGGVRTISVANGGAGYAANPVIKITGDGVGASAIPVLTNGVLTAITITNPGNGYTAPVVTINGGNPTTAATLGTVSMNPAASASGSLTKIGTGTLTLTGTSTYTGGTLINAGVLVAGANGALGTGNVSIGTNSVAATLTISAGLTNAIADGANLSILGTGAGASKLNLLSTSETISQLTLGGTPQVIGTYGSTDSTAMFKNNTYFTGTGILNVTAIVPEPGTWALLGLGVVALGVTEYRRRRQLALA